MKLTVKTGFKSAGITRYAIDHYAVSVCFYNARNSEVEYRWGVRGRRGKRGGGGGGRIQDVHT